MDAKHFDHLARTLSADGSRRGLLRLLGALPLFGWLTLFLADDGAAKRRNGRGKERSKGGDKKRDKVGADNHKHEGRRRKHRNKRNHDHKDKDKDKDKKKKCKPESAAQTCDGKCGQVQNNCQKSVDCGSCACEPACAACQVCDEASQSCVPDPAQEAESCGGCRICADGECVIDASIVCTAVDQCHEVGECDPETGACTNPQKPDGTPCGANGECVNGVCEEVACLALGQACESGNQCCDADCEPSEQFFCSESGDLCCHQAGESCSGECDCCGPSSCEDSTCCHFTQDTCQSATDCCQNFLNRQDCVNNRCCALPEEPCEAEGDCCEGLCDPEDSVCTSCLALQRSCEDASQCCQRGGPTLCEFSFDFNDTNCCRPQGGVCEETHDCCDGATCCNGVCCDAAEVCVNNVCQPVCRAHGELCSSVPDPCCPGFECRFAPFDENRCRPVICWEFLETCTGSTRPCCEGECTTLVFGEIRSCCRPEGGACDDIPVPYPGSHCCGTNFCNGAGLCEPCRQLGETCEGSETASSCCNSPEAPPQACLACRAGVCVRCSG